MRRVLIAALALGSLAGCRSLSDAHKASPLLEAVSFTHGIASAVQVPS